jgi:hypothetical protein
VLRFHLASGVRLAQRAFAPLVGVLVVAVGVSQSPAATLRAMAAAAAAPRPSASTLGALVAIAVAIAAWAGPRLAFSTAGWIRHLPASAVSHRRAAALAIAAAELPLVAGVVVLAALARASGAPTDAARLPGVVLAAVAVGAAFAPSTRPAVAFVVGLAATVAALAFGAVGLLAAVALLFLGDRLGGAPATKPTPVHAPRPSRLPLAETVALRVAAPALPGALAFAAIPFAAGYALVRNNPDLPAILAGRGARLAGTVAVAVLVARAVDRLALLRPPWPWARSLPWTARRRVLADATALALLGAPGALASGWIHGLAVFAVTAASVPFLALRGAAALRRSLDEPSPPSGAILAEGAFVAALLALAPWLALAVLALLPWALAAAVRRERDLRVSRWAAMHHLAAGDPLSWRAR